MVQICRWVWFSGLCGWVLIVVSMTYQIVVVSLPLGFDFRCALLVCLGDMVVMDLVVLLMRLGGLVFVGWLLWVLGWWWLALFWAGL